MIGMYFAVGNANHLPPWGGLDMLLSTNPIAVAVPAGEEPPVVLDMATTVAAYGKVKAKAQRGEQMPIGWMIDRTGAPLTDPKRSEEGFLLPIGGYKGYGLALIIGLLAGTLNGAAMGSETIDFNKDQASVTNTGQAILVIDPDAFGELEAFKARVDKLVRELRASARMPGVDRIWLPGEQSHAKRLANERDGMALPPALLAQLDAFARELGMPTLQET
jgi:LDH2 family malate/lactate/ureidoglycolate dehydrogenase